MKFAEKTSLNHGSARCVVRTERKAPAGRVMFTAFQQRLALACRLTCLPAGFLHGLVSLEGLAHVVAGGRMAVL